MGAVLNDDDDDSDSAFGDADEQDAADNDEVPVAENGAEAVEPVAYDPPPRGAKIFRFPRDYRARFSGVIHFDECPCWVCHPNDDLDGVLSDMTFDV